MNFQGGYNDGFKEVIEKIKNSQGLTSALEEMMMFYLSNDMIIPGSTYWNMVIGQKPGDAQG